MQKALVFLLFILSCIPAISQQINPLLAQDDQVNQQIEKGLFKLPLHD